MIEFMILPFIACLILTGITVYFGIHVIKREIIFIDIALAQIAALGSSVALVLQETLTHQHIHHAENGGVRTPEYALSLFFILLAAMVFTILKNRKIKVPLEAFIGITFAVATTGAVIILDKGAGGDTHIHDMLAGSILWVSLHQVMRLLIVVFVVGLFHFIFRKKFKALTDSYHNPEEKLTNPKLWDFLFYFTFGFVIIEAVNIAGIILVFAFLIIPASISSLFFTTWSNRFLTGLIIGTTVSFCGLYLSWVMDIASSPAIILFLSISLFIGIIILVLRMAINRKKKLPEVNIK
jgi:zinc/manganese transport system permease protein